MKTLFKNCDIVTTTDSGFEVIRNGFCGVDGVYICYLGTDMPAEKYDIIKDMTGRVLYPGLINAHNHAAMTLLRGIGSDLPLKEWLYDNMFPTEDKLRAEDVKAALNRHRQLFGYVLLLRHHGGLRHRVWHEGQPLPRPLRI